MKNYLTTLICSLTWCATYAQQIQGVVLDDENSEPLQFVSIGVVGTSAGTISNVDGYYILSTDDAADEHSVSFSYIGYQTVSVPLSQLRKSPNVRMKPAAINLSEVSIYARDLTAEEILEEARARFSQNHPKPQGRQRIFLHEYEETPFDAKNQVVIKKSNFEGLSKSTAQEFLAMLPDRFTEYRDAIMDVYFLPDDQKIIPVEAVSLEENAQKELEKKVEQKLGTFFEDIESTNAQEGVYYKLRTGIFAFNLDDSDDDNQEDSESQVIESDSLHYSIATKSIKAQLDFLRDEYADINSKNWEFVNKPRKYKYQVGELTVFNDELVYPISFTPKSGGLFKGTMYISGVSFAVIQLDFAYDEGKSSGNVQLLGIGHSMAGKKGHVIFEHTDKGYMIKYINAQQHEIGSIDRRLTIMKKQKRFLWDKELNEIKLDINLTFDTESYWEMLVLDRDKALDVQSDQPEFIKYRKEYTHSPEMWKDQTVIAPVADLQKYQRTK